MYTSLVNSAWDLLKCCRPIHVIFVHVLEDGERRCCWRLVRGQTNDHGCKQILLPISGGDCGFFMSQSILVRTDDPHTSTTRNYGSAGEKRI